MQKEPICSYHSLLQSEYLTNYRMCFPRDIFTPHRRELPRHQFRRHWSKYKLDQIQAPWVSLKTPMSSQMHSARGGVWGREAGTPPTMRGSGSGGVSRGGAAWGHSPVQPWGPVFTLPPRIQGAPQAAGASEELIGTEGSQESCCHKALPWGWRGRLSTQPGESFSQGMHAAASSVNVLHFQRAKYFPVLLSPRLPQSTNSHHLFKPPATTLLFHSQRVTCLFPESSGLCFHQQRASGVPVGIFSPPLSTSQHWNQQSSAAQPLPLTLP